MPVTLSPTASPAKPRLAESAPLSPRLLILKENSVSADELETTLATTGWDYDIVSVGSVAELVAPLEQFQPQAVLLVCTLYRFDAITAVGLIRKKVSVRPLVIGLGPVTDDALAALSAAGADVLADQPSALSVALASIGGGPNAIRPYRVPGVQSEYQRMFDTADDGLLMLDTEEVIEDVNVRACTLLGYGSDALIGKTLEELGVFGEDAATQHLLANVRKYGHGYADTLVLHTRTGRTLQVTFLANTFTDSDKRHVRVALRPISASGSQAGAMPSQSPDLRYLAQQRFVGTVIVGSNAEILEVKAAVANFIGYTPMELAGKSVLTFLPDDKKDTYKSIIQAGLAGEPVVAQLISGIVTKDGNKRDILVDTTATTYRNEPAIISAIFDVSNRSDNEPGLALEMLILKTEHDLSPDGILVVNDSRSIISYNSRLLDILGIPTPQHRLTMETDIIAHEAAAVQDGDALRARIEEIYSHQDRSSQDYIRLADDRTLERYSSPMHASNGSYVGRVWFYHETTVRSRLEREKRRSSDRLKTLSLGNTLVLRASGENALIGQMARTIADAGGYALAWIGLVEDPQTMTLRTAAIAGSAAERLSEGEPIKPVLTFYSAPVQSVSDAPTPSGKTTKVVFPETWQQIALACGVHSTTTFPIISGADVIGAVVIGSSDAAAIEQADSDTLSELAEDLGYGIAALRLRDRNQAVLERLNSSWDAMVHTIGRVVEFRDPYTAGHQERVALLAVAIARELKLSDDDVHAIRTASLVHDVGKIYVPSDILTKPGILSSLEFEVLKTHTQAGSNILNDIEFPWPIAEITLQHHERLDGSGYPNQLKGDEILMPAKIIAVADVMEAMTTHRPYRPAHALDEALAEIHNGRGSRYDAAAVDACTKLFHRFDFSETDGSTE